MASDFDGRLANGNTTYTEVVEYLVERHYKDVRRLALSLLNNDEDADDVVQKTIMKAADKIDQYEPHTNLKAWLCRFCVNIARTHQQKQTRRWRIRTLSFSDRPVCDTTTPEEVTMLNERNRQLWSAVKTLPDKHRITVTLFYVFDFTTQEIADILNVRHGTVRSRLCHARRELHGLLTATEVTQ